MEMFEMSDHIIFVILNINLYILFCRYLCEYIYYTSLSVDNTRTLFIHVPDISIYPSEITAKALEKILELCLEQVIEIDTSKEVLEKNEDADKNEG